MYEAFYGLTGKPFQLSPDPKFYFDSREHRKAMAYLQYGLHQNEGFIVVTGEVGAGKTTLVRSLFQQLDAGQVVAANLVSTQLSADGMLSMVASAFGIPTDSSDKPRVLRSIEVFLASVAQEDKRCLLVVDEAQNLSAGAVEELPGRKKCWGDLVCGCCGSDAVGLREASPVQESESLVPRE